MNNDKRTEEDLFHRTWAREQYVRVLIFNLVVAGIETALACVLVAWYVLSNVFWIDSMDSLGLMLLPIFFHGSLLLPILGVWLWACYVRMDASRRRWWPITLISALEVMYASVGGFLTFSMLRAGFPWWTT